MKFAPGSEGYQAMVAALAAAPQAPAAPNPAPNPKLVHWLDFVRFITDQDMWSRWTWEDNLDPSEQYLLDCYQAALDKKTLSSFDFSKTNAQVFSRDAGSLNWEHDGESLWYFYNIFQQGKRV